MPLGRSMGNSDRGNFVLLAIARLDPDNGSATIESLQRAAHIVGRELRMQLV
jgi:hypothetical protein